MVCSWSIVWKFPKHELCKKGLLKYTPHPRSANSQQDLSGSTEMNYLQSRPWTFGCYTGWWVWALRKLVYFPGLLDPLLAFLSQQSLLKISPTYRVPFLGAKMHKGLSVYCHLILLLSSRKPWVDEQFIGVCVMWAEWVHGVTVLAHLAHLVLLRVGGHFPSLPCPESPFAPMVIEV